MEKETIKEEIKSMSIQLQNKKISSTGLTNVLASVHPKLSGRTDAPVGLFLLDANWDQVKILYVTRWTDGSKLITGVLDVLLPREHVWVAVICLQHQLNRRFRNNHRCIRCTMFQRASFGRPQILFNTGWTDASESTTGALDVLYSRELVLSWSVNLFSTGWTDAPMEHAPVQWRKPRYCVRNPNGY